MIEPDWCCQDCGVDTDAIDEYYMVTDPLWEQATHGEIAGHLCIGCLEQRLGRTLHATDFTDYYVNTTHQLRRSPRLIARLQD
jgi:hypothetical protein